VRVLALGHTAELGGAEIGFGHLARHLPVDLSVMLLADGPLAGRIRDAGRRVVVRDLDAALAPPLGAVERARGLRALRRAVLDEVDAHRADVVLLNTHRVTRLVAACALPARVRCVTMLRDGLRPPHLSRRDAVLSHAAVNRVSHTVVANSAWTRDQLLTRRPTAVVAPVVDAAFFDTPRVPAPGEMRVLVLARMAAWKGQLFALRALAGARVPLRVTVAGGAWFGEQRYADEVRRFAEAHPELGVELPGHVEDVVDLIDRHDVLLHPPLLPEPFGQVIVQGLARGRVVLAADRGGPAEVVTPGWDGLHFRTGDAADLARAVERLAADPALAARLRENAPRTARLYHPGRTGARLHAVLKSSSRPVTATL
jgi:glycosyltransferase involved in cell wall biosynthesis